MASDGLNEIKFLKDSSYLVRKTKLQTRARNLERKKRECLDSQKQKHITTTANQRTKRTKQQDNQRNGQVSKISINILFVSLI